MSRKNRGKNTAQFSNQNQGGFVPASQQQAVRRGRNTATNAAFEFSPAAAGPQESFSQYSRGAVDYSSRKRGLSRGKKTLLTVLIIILAAALITLGVFVYKEIQKSMINDDLHNLSQDELIAVDNELTGHTTFEEPFTMLLLGSDARTNDPFMGARTDTIILTRIDPTINQISMVSIPRDTMIEIDGQGTQKFNAAYTFGGPSGTIAAVKELCDVDIDHYAEINFEGLVGLIDSIGGIDVVVDEPVNDPDAGPDIIPAGEQHLSGSAALTFSRSRAYADGDFTRVSNQRKVIEAIVHRGLEAPASELYGLVQACTGFLTTDSGVDVDFIYSLADQIRHNNDYPLELRTATIPATTSTIGGVSYVVADTAGVAELMKLFLEGGDISQPIEASSIDSDLSAAGATAAPVSSLNYDYEEPIYYTPQQNYTYTPDPTPAPDPSYGGGTTGTTGTGSGGGTSTGGSTGGTSGTTSGGSDSGTTGGGSGVDAGGGTTDMGTTSVGAGAGGVGGTLNSF